MVNRRLKGKTTILVLIVFIYNTFGFLLIQPLFSNFLEYFDIVKHEDRNSFAYFYCICNEPGDALEVDLELDENSLNKKERPSDNQESNNGYSEPVYSVTPGQIHLPVSIYINSTRVHYLHICRDILTPPPQLI